MAFLYAFFHFFKVYNNIMVTHTLNALKASRSVGTHVHLFLCRKFYTQEKEQQGKPGKKSKCLILWRRLLLLLGLYCWNVYFRVWNDLNSVKFQTLILPAWPQTDKCLSTNYYSDSSYFCTNPVCHTVSSVEVLLACHAVDQEKTARQRKWISAVDGTFDIKKKHSS